MVEGKRSGANVKQKTLCYLGPLSRLVAGVPEEVKKDVDLRLRVDWKKIDDEIARFPLSFEELSETRRAQFAISVRMRARQGRPTRQLAENGGRALRAIDGSGAPIRGAV